MKTKPTIAMIPSAYKDGKLFSVMPSDGSGDFDVIRSTLATRVNKDGLIELVNANVPRLDYSDGSCPVLLMEDAKTNRLIHSSDVTQSSWTIGSSTTITRAFPSIVQGSLATRLSMPSSSGTWLDSSFTSANGAEYTFSFYAKDNGGSNTFNFGFYSQSSVQSPLTVETGIVTNEWKRFSITYTSTVDGLLYVGVDNENNNSNVDMLIDGFQLESTNIATSYIPTNGATATRGIDRVSDAGNSSTFNNYEGVLYTDVSSEDLTDSKVIGLFGDGTNQRVSFTFFQGDTSNLKVFVITPSDLLEVNYSVNFDFRNRNKIALKYMGGELKIFVNGVLGVTDTYTGDLELKELSLAKGDNSQRFYGKVYDVRYYNKALSDEELINLTN